MKRHLGTLLILLGIGIIAVPLVGRYIAAKRQEEMMAAFFEENAIVTESDDYDNLSESLEWGTLEENQNEINEGANEAAEVAGGLEVSEIGNEEIGITERSDTSDSLEDGGGLIAKPKTVALLEIDKIDVYLPVAEGTDQVTLKYALGHMPETADIGAVGNSVIAGHRGHSFGTYFSRLDEMEVGDEIKVSKAGKTYIYEVFDIVIVEPTDLSVLRGSSNHQVLTLITCHPMYTSTHRLVVHAVVRED